VVDPYIILSQIPEDSKWFTVLDLKIPSLLSLCNKTPYTFLLSSGKISLPGKDNSVYGQYCPRDFKIALICLPRYLERI
jgi:hypothetical protein